MNKFIGLSTIVVLFLLLCNPLIASAGKSEDDSSNHKRPITIRTEVDRNKMTLGTIFKYSLIIHYSPGYKVNLPGWGANVGQFEIRDYKDATKEQEDGSIVSTSEYSLAIYDTGTFTIPPVVVYYSLPGQEEDKSIQSDKIDIEVESVAPNEAKDIKGLKTQALIAPDYRTVYIITIISILLVTIVIITVIYIKKSKKKG